MIVIDVVWIGIEAYQDRLKEARRGEQGRTQNMSIMIERNARKRERLTTTLGAVVYSI